MSSLAADLRRVIAGEVRFDATSRALYSTDASNYRLVPIGVVVPRSVDDVLATLEVCRKHEAPVVSRGGGTSLSGQTANTAVVIDHSKYLTAILDLDPDRRVARVQPGLVLDELRQQAERHGLTFGPDPATHNRCTIGGMIGNNSCGVHSIMAGKTEENVEGLDVVTYEGLRMDATAMADAEIAVAVAGGGRMGELVQGLLRLRDDYADLIRERYPDIPRRVSGYNLPSLLPERGFHLGQALVGSESTCVTVLEARLRLVPSPRARALALLPYGDITQAADAVSDVMQHDPIGLEGFDHRLSDVIRTRGLHVDDLALLPDAGAWLLVEFGGDDEDEARGRADGCAHRVNGARVIHEPDQQARVWELREAALGASRLMPDGTRCWPGWDDAAVAPERLGDYLREFQSLLRSYDLTSMLYGHFGHGCVHAEIAFDLASREGVQRFRRFLREATELVVRYGGSISGEHGDGQARGELLPLMFGEELVSAMRRFKALWDPTGRMNPGKIVDPLQIDSDLRLAPANRPRPVSTAFAYPDDGGSFAHAAERCAGVGLCRRHGGATMCPSYMATREEQHSTRGRARLLYEMLNGQLEEGWRNSGVREALDLCLACKGCLHECPVAVDMATYKAEFMHHHYRHRLRPRAAYAMGLLHLWAPMAGAVPSLANGISHGGATAPLAKRLGGIAAQRALPPFAPTPLRRSLRHRPRQRGATVLLFADTFTDYFHPDAGHAALRVIEALGHTVAVPRGRACCGRPLYDFGMLDLARATLRRALRTLHPAIAAGVPVIVLEPSCMATFRDELVKLLPNDEDAARLSKQVMTLSEFLLRDGEDWQPVPRSGDALLHGHCHQKALGGLEADREALTRAGLTVREPAKGCCGMAGSFGFDARHIDVSLAIAEHELLPAVRAAPAETLLVADGFSCREQIRQGTGRTAIHTAEALDPQRPV
jgi:FAD/FMN-containing dehydrogenase/Fe-S oxidoreductase